jgi:hypothetical protein
MSGAWKQFWNLRVPLGWALLGPAFVLLVEVESVLAVLDGLAFHFRPPGQLRGWQTLIGGAVLVIVLAAQLSTALWRRLGSARSQVSQRRRAMEAKVYADTYLKPTGGKVTSKQDASPGPIPDSGPVFGFALWPPAPLTAVFGDDSEDGNDFKWARRILERFGLEPSWAYQQLDENLAVPAARRLTQRARLTEARWAGHATALTFALIAIPVTVVWLVVSTQTAASAKGETAVAPAVVLGLLLVLSLGQYFATGIAGRTVIRHEGQFYPQVEALLELHRFELYRALAVPSPRDSIEERKGRISAWRLGEGLVIFEQEDTGGGGDVRQQVAGLTEMLLGPELTEYNGFVSWNVGEDRVELAFGHTPVLGGGHARLQVNGSPGGSYAPFDITADSEGVSLVDVRKAVQVPVGEGEARTVFDFQRLSDAGPQPPELWFEISQHGRFIQLLRVKAPRPADQPRTT